MELCGGQWICFSGQEARTSVSKSQSDRCLFPPLPPPPPPPLPIAVLKRLKAQFLILENPQSSKDVMTLLGLQVEKHCIKNEKLGLPRWRSG